MTGDIRVSDGDCLYGSDPSGGQKPQRRAISRFMLLTTMVVAGCVAIFGSPSTLDSMMPVAELDDGRAVLGREQASDLARSSATRVRVDELTSETTEVWALPEGGFEAVLSAGPVRVRRDGGWVPVDLTLVKDPSDDSVRTVADANEIWLSGAKPTGSHELVSVGTGGTGSRSVGPARSRNRCSTVAALPTARPFLGSISRSTSLVAAWRPSSWSRARQQQSE